MWKPEESLDDYIVKAAPEAAEPPRPVSVRPTGEVEVLKPLARWEGPPKPESVAVAVAVAVDTPQRTAPHRLSWFHRSLALGALAMIAFILASAFFIGTYDGGVDTARNLSDTAGDPGDPAMDASSVDTPVPTDGPLITDIFTMTSSPLKFEGRRTVRSIARRKPARQRARFAAYRPRRQSTETQLVVSQFVPTTLVIYIENGEIKTRIEPQPTTGSTNPLTHLN
jgi:hypothetical protein